jgi:hypothetical protein
MTLERKMKKKLSDSAANMSVERKEKKKEVRYSTTWLLTLVQFKIWTQTKYFLWKLYGRNLRSVSALSLTLLLLLLLHPLLLIIALFKLYHTDLIYTGTKKAEFKQYEDTTCTSIEWKERYEEWG